ncbi:ubiquitin carboxyl-terminal hydrolase [Seminavis robusta]|uniref:Ubiquitin carboxyl-terminal hydrolase n=1 Tax=Seminavis robusta TaxID=568900 RepID=A0A9N8DDA2_9STRA|nr:ubiquitin carboxyl-terminal hydrolase [Seminavis robusta]|eukprot:Sro37_g023270.1 ubiquitin carboxyl-terminal hydrolase (480) ;mRNA; f:94265-95795
MSERQESGSFIEEDNCSGQREEDENGDFPMKTFGDDEDDDDDDEGDKGEMDYSPSTGVICTVLTPTPAMTEASEVSTADGHYDSSTAYALNLRRDQLYHQMFLLSVATAAAWAVLIATLLPWNVLLALSAVAVSSGLLSFVGFQRFLLEFRLVLAGDGLVQFLPQSMVDQLTNTSLHQFMRDDTFFREWGFMAIYLVPGISEDQINAYIRRLPRHRRNLLTRPGLGHFLGDPVMRVLVGENRWQQQAIVGNTIEHPTMQVSERAASVPRALLEGSNDEDSEGDEQERIDGSVSGVVDSPIVATRSLIASSPETAAVATMAARALFPPIPRDAGDDEASCDSDDSDDNLLMDPAELIGAAIQDVMMSYARWAGTNAFLVTHDYLVEPALIASGATGLGMSFLSFGLGMWQYSNRPRTSSYQQSSMFTSGSFLIGSGVIGGLSAGALIYSRSAIRSFIMGQPPTQAASKSRTNPQPPKPKR